MIDMQLCFGHEVEASLAPGKDRGSHWAINYIINLQSCSFELPYIWVESIIYYYYKHVEVNYCSEVYKVLDSIRAAASEEQLNLIVSDVEKNRFNIEFESILKSLYASRRAFICRRSSGYRTYLCWATSALLMQEMFTDEYIFMPHEFYCKVRNVFLNGQLLDRLS